MTEQERKVVNHAMKILEQSQDDEAMALAVKLLEQGEKSSSPESVVLCRILQWLAWRVFKNIRPNTRWWLAYESEQKGNAILRSREEACRELY